MCCLFSQQQADRVVNLISALMYHLHVYSCVCITVMTISNLLLLHFKSVSWNSLAKITRNKMFGWKKKQQDKVPEKRTHAQTHTQKCIPQYRMQILRKKSCLVGQECNGWTRRALSAIPAVADLNLAKWFKQWKKHCIKHDISGETEVWQIKKTLLHRVETAGSERKASTEVYT